MCFNMPVTKEVPYSLLNESHLGNMLFETHRNIYYSIHIMLLMHAMLDRTTNIHFFLIDVY
jgi:hypothetical protein